MQQEQKLTLESLKRILAEHDERLNRLENGEVTFNPDKLWTPHDVAEYAGCSYGYVMQTLIKLPGFPATLGNPRPRSPKKYRAADVIAFFKNRNQVQG